MRRIIVFIVIIIFTSLIIGCSGSSDLANANQATDAVPRFSDAGQALAEGKHLLDINQTEKAIDAFNQAAALDPGMGEAYFQLGIAYGLLENEQKGALQTGDEIPSSGTEKSGHVKSESERAFEKAVDAYKRSLESNPNDDAAQFNLGRALNKLNKDDGAEKAFRQAVKLKPDDTEYQTELGAILIKLAKYHEAIIPLKKALELDPDNSQAENLLEDAEAGRKRVDYVVVKKKDEKDNTNSATNTDEKLDDEQEKPVKAEDKNPKPSPKPSPSRKPSE